MSDLSFSTLLARWPWKPLRGCPGRYSLAMTRMTPAEVVEGGIEARDHGVLPSGDRLLVLLLSDGSGLISYQKPDGFFVHTLNTPAGLARKLGRLGLGNLCNT